MMRAIQLMLLIAVVVAVPASSFGAVFVSVTIAPPLLPVYVQPACPGEGYIWVPGYWAYGPDGYYWVPGTWVLAPYVGALWTPGYWGSSNSLYVWNPGYWGYGVGYTGYGYHGGYWRNGGYYYNRAVNNVNVTNVHNTYYSTVANNTTMRRVSYHGGPGGTTVQPTGQERAAP